MNILTVNLLFSTLVFGIAARLYLIPRLGEWSPRNVLIPILLLHSLRHLGLMFLAPGAVYAGIPEGFARPAAYGDLLAAFARAGGSRGARGERQSGARRYGFSTSKERRTWPWRSRSPPFTRPRRSWGRLNGYRPFGFRRFWSRTTSSS